MIFLNIGVRDFIDLIQNLTESVTFHPAEMTHTEHGIMVGVPDEYVKIEKEECYYCDGTGKFTHDGETEPCGPCRGTGMVDTHVWDVPQMNVANRNAGVISEFLGVGDEESGWIPHDQIPLIKRRLIQLKNGDMSGYEISPTDERHTRVDRSEDIPRISSGPRMIDFGLTSEQLQSYIDRLMPMLDFAQQRGLGVSWA